MLTAPASGDLFESEDLTALERIGAQAAAQLERLLARVSMRTVRDPVAAVSVDVDALTPREREVLSLLARGHSNRQIAEELVIGIRTAETHVDHILRKLALANRAQAIIWAHEHLAPI